MKFTNPRAETFIPDDQPVETALSRTTHLGIGAHQDDLEMLAFHGIEACFDAPDRWFCGITCTSGSGSPRAGVYADHTDMQMRDLRRREQRQAAYIGRYGAMVQLDHESAALRGPGRADLEEDLKTALTICRPEVVYTHNLADKHFTHVATALAALSALRSLPLEQRPRQVLGVEVWRDLDWLIDEDKAILDVSGRDNLAAALLGVFDSQLAGGKRYDLATLARRRAHATFLESHAVDSASQLCFAMDLTPLIVDDSLSPAEYVSAFIGRFETAVVERLKSLTEQC